VAIPHNLGVAPEMIIAKNRGTTGYPFVVWTALTGSADGPMVVTGFRPRWILIKIAVGGTDSWLLYDAIRSPYNVVDDFVQPNNSEQEATGNSNALDFLSNGFKLRGSVAGTNGSGNTYIYAAFAETPSFNLFGGQSNAR